MLPGIIWVNKKEPHFFRFFSPHVVFLIEILFLVDFIEW